MRSQEKGARAVQSAVVDQIRKLRRKAKGKNWITFGKFAEVLNVRGLKSASGKKFNAGIWMTYCISL